MLGPMSIEKSCAGCGALILLFLLAGMFTNAYRSVKEDLARSERLVEAEATAVKWEQKWMNNGEDQYPYWELTVSFENEKGKSLTRRVLMEWDEKELEEGDTLPVVYDPQNDTFVKWREMPDTWRETGQYRDAFLMLAMTVVLVLVVLIWTRISSEKSKD